MTHEETSLPGAGTGALRPQNGVASACVTESAGRMWTTYLPGIPRAKARPGKRTLSFHGMRLNRQWRRVLTAKKTKKTRLVRTSRVSGMGIGTGLEIPAEKTGSKSNDRGFDFERWDKSGADDLFFCMGAKRWPGQRKRCSDHSMSDGMEFMVFVQRDQIEAPFGSCNLKGTAAA